MYASLENPCGKKLSAALVVLVMLAVGRRAQATDYYVATTGSDSNPGTMASPFATLQKGASAAVAGDTVFIRGGTYKTTTPASTGAGIQFTKSGSSDTSRIRYWAYPGEVPVFDFTNMTISTTGYTHGFVVTGSWLHFKGLEIANVPMNTFSNNGVAVSNGGNCIFEQLNMHHNSGNGIFIGKGNGGHLVLNCDAHDNYDATSSQGQGQNADGFGVHYQTAGATTVIRGCRAWWNSDDGYDLINQEMPVTVENSWAMGNGYAMYGTFNPAMGNGNGFKMGSSATGVRHLVQNNVAWRNKASGLYANHSSGGNTWYNNTSFMNGTQYNMLASPPNDPNTTITLTGAMAHIMRNNIGYPNRNSNMTGVDTQFNSWDLTTTPAATDFLSIADPSVSGTGIAIESSGALGPRAADGSLPPVDFLKLVTGSRMIDKGTDVGLPFLGTAPDLGAYEFGASTSTATGGSSGGGGGPGTGGRTTAGAGGATGTSGGGGNVGSGGTPAGAGGNAGLGGGQAGAGGAGPSGGTGGAGPSGGGAGAGPGLGASGGCACAIDEGGERAGMAWALMLAGAVGLLRRRRQGDARVKASRF